MFGEIKVYGELTEEVGSQYSVHFQALNFQQIIEISAPEFKVFELLIP